MGGLQESLRPMRSWILSVPLSPSRATGCCRTWLRGVMLGAGLEIPWTKKAEWSRIWRRQDASTSNEVIPVTRIRLSLRRKEAEKEQWTAKEAGWGVAGWKNTRYGTWNNLESLTPLTQAIAEPTTPRWAVKIELYPWWFSSSLEYKASSLSRKA